MAMQQCPNGHLYDDSKNSSCPYCGNNSIDVTIPLTNPGDMPFNQGMFPPTAKLDQPFEPPHPQPQQPPQPPQQPPQIPRTAPVNPSFGVTTYKHDIINEKGIIDVRGWLVCLHGKKRGMDFKIHGEKNTIGRGPENDIALDFDNTISKGVNAIIAYDQRNNKFYLYQGASKNNMYFNDQLLINTVEIKDYDVIEIGETKMLFRTLCNEHFTWENLDK